MEKVIAHIHDNPMEWLCERERAIHTPKNDQVKASMICYTDVFSE